MTVLIIVAAPTFAVISIALRLEQQLRLRGYIIRPGKLGFWGETDR